MRDSPSGAIVHNHRDCGAKDRLWLPKDHAEAATAVPHAFCVSCGTVRDQTAPRGRPLGYFLNGVAYLKEHLEYSAVHPKLAQVQSHLIAGRIAVRPEFEDPYGTPGWRQLQAYVQIIRSVRPDLEEELLLRLLPGPRRRRRLASSGDRLEPIDSPQPRY